MEDFTNSRPHQQEQAVSVIVELRRRDNSASPVKAHADVEIRIGLFGSVHILGFSIYQPDGKAAVVFPPAQKGERKSFPHVRLTGKIRAMVESAILREYLGAEEAASN